MAPQHGGRGRAKGRDRAAQSRWLEEKRHQPDASTSLTSSEDFRAYYQAQRLFGSGPHAAEEFTALWQILHTPLPVTVRVASRLPSFVRLEEKLQHDGWACRKEFQAAGLSVWELQREQYSGQLRSWTERENRCGSLSFQELVSLVPALLLAPEPEHICLDLCAAPGSKSMQLLAAMQSRANGKDKLAGAVLSSDSDPKRCCLALYRLLSKAETPASCSVLANAKDFPHFSDNSCNIGGAPSRLGFSRILADVPCSGDGTLRKNAQQWRVWSRREALSLFTVQRNILMRAFFLMPPGGLLVYSTCSLNPVENEAVVQAALQRWREREGVGPITLLDTGTACQQVCSLPVSKGLTRWVVAAPVCGGDLFCRWEDVPEDLQAESRKGELLREEMFASQDASELQNCARLFPHHGNIGGFFVALFRKDHTIARPLEPAATNQGAWNRSKALHTRQHPLLTAQYSRIHAEDTAWQEIATFFDLDSMWAEDLLRRGLLFWQHMKGQEQPARVAITSPGVARLWDASTGGRELPWVRLGLFLFEHLPRNLLQGAVSSRWRPTSEGVALLAGALGERRLIRLPVGQLLWVLRAEHRQALMQDLPGICDRAGCISNAGAEVACGGVVVGLHGLPSWEHICLPGVISPRQLRLLVDDDTANSLLEILAREPHEPCVGTTGVRAAKQAVPRTPPFWYLSRWASWICCGKA